MHLWWNRSPIESSKQLLKDIISGPAELAGIHDQEITENNDRLINKNVTIVDPFSGFGGLVLAATETGYPVKAGDLNSVAALLTKAETEIPSQFADLHPVSSSEKDNSYIGVRLLLIGVLFIIIGILSGNHMPAIASAIISTIGSFAVWEASAIWIETLPVLRKRERVLNMLAGSGFRFTGSEGK